jgi:DNA-binding beta-propeller fold protein YncE
MTPDGRVIITDYFQVILINNGTVNRVWGEKNQAGSKLGQFNSSLDTAVDKYGSIFVADYNNQRVQILDPTNDNITLLAPRNISGRPLAVAIHPVTGDVFVTMKEPYVLVFTDQGEYKQNVTLLYQVNDLTVDAHGYIYVTDGTNYSIHIYDPAWNIQQILGGRHGNCRDCFFSPLHVSINTKNGDILVGYGSERVVRLFRKQQPDDEI